MNGIYQEIPSLSVGEIMDRLHSANSEELTLLLLGLTELDDWPWVQDVYLKFINDKNIWVASAAISGLGDLARIHRQIGKELVVKALTDLASSRKELIGKIGDALDDIAIFT